MLILLFLFYFFRNFQAIYYSFWDKGFYILLFLTVDDKSVVTQYGRNQVFELQVALKLVVFVKETSVFFFEFTIKCSSFWQYSYFNNQIHLRWPHPYLLPQVSHGHASDTHSGHVHFPYSTLKLTKVVIDEINFWER